MALSSLTLLTTADLLEASLEPNWVIAAPEPRTALLVDLNDTAALGEQQLSRLGDWLVDLVAPVVGVGGGEHSMLADLVDLRLADETEARTALDRIDDNPVAAAVLVQVLRRTLNQDLRSALLLESLAYGTLQGGEEFRRWLARYRAGHADGVPLQGEGVVNLERDGAALSVVLNDVATRNALSAAMRDELTDAFELVAMDDTITRVTVSGNGPCFSAGGHLGEFGSAEDLARAHRIRSLRMPARFLASRAQCYTFELHGACVGAGIELPAFGGRVTATEDTFFQLPEVSMGLIPGAGGCVSIPRRIGRQRTARMAILGERISAAEALAWGLIDALVDDPASAQGG